MNYSYKVVKIDYTIFEVYLEKKDSPQYIDKYEWDTTYWMAAYGRGLPEVGDLLMFGHYGFAGLDCRNLVPYEPEEASNLQHSGIIEQIVGLSTTEYLGNICHELFGVPDRNPEIGTNGRVFDPATCQHEWIQTMGFNRMYTDCSKCGEKKD